VARIHRSRNSNKEKIMSAQEIVTMQKQLVDIEAAISALMRSTRWLRRPDTVVQVNLSHIWDVTLDLQRRIAQPAVVKGMCCDALDQVVRVYDLLTECEGVPNGDQLTSIGYACELAAEKIKLYQQMARHAAQVKAMAETAAMEVF
jgi:hypothetical protein